MTHEERFENTSPWKLLARIRRLEADVEKGLETQVVLSQEVLELAEMFGALVKAAEATHLIRKQMTKRIFELERRLNGLSSDSVEN